MKSASRMGKRSSPWSILDGHDAEASHRRKAAWRPSDSVAWRSRSPTRSTLPTLKASSTATSNQRTSSSPSADTPRFSTSGWRRSVSTGSSSSKIASLNTADGGRGASDQSGHDGGNGGLYVAGASAGEGIGCPHRPVLFRSGAVRDGDGRIAFPWREFCGDLQSHSGRGSHPRSAAESRCASRTGTDHQQGTGERSQSALPDTQPTCVPICNG